YRCHAPRDPAGDQHPAGYDADLAGARASRLSRHLIRQAVPLAGGGRFMRSLKLDRKPRDNPRARSARKPARGSRERKAAPGYSARDDGEGEGLLIRLLRPLLISLLGLFRRPILLMSLGLVLF